MKRPQLGEIFEIDFEYTKEQVIAYAALSGDTNPIHVSEVYANGTGFKQCIVHGFFSISIFSKVYGTLLYADGNILISQSVKYIRPIFSGVVYTAKFTVLEIIPTKMRVKYLNEIVEKKSGEIRVTGESILMNKIHYNYS